jgi:hypothetical protein
LPVVLDNHRPLAGLLVQFKSDRSSFPLPNSCGDLPCSHAGDVFDPNGDDIAAAKLAVDRQIEHRQVASAAFDLEFRPDRPDMFGQQRRLRATGFPLFHGTRLGVEIVA